MASTNRSFTSFTITQPFLGAPLQFQPALGSQELEDLIDAFVTGSASKQDKLSEVTIDFYTNATVDLNTGALVRRYDVALSSPWHAFEQSPLQSQSSGFSPPMFTPSPASSATFGDSSYGSISMTPPNQNRGPRPSKKAKKDTKKTAEIRLPGFSIMTKDGVDVTSTAGRGTKTKEQREHAHLMRIMKACDACKKKKIRCDPSHRRSHNDMSRTSTSTTKSSSSNDPSPTSSLPSLSRETTYNSQESLPSFGTNAIDDFVLFPEDAWNPADISLSGLDQGCDLSQFNFDINDMGLNDYATTSAGQSFDFSFDQPMDFEQSNYDPVMMDQYGLDQWASPIGDQQVPHTRPHHSLSSQDSGQLDSSFFESSPDGSLSYSELFQESPVSTTAPATGYANDRSLHDQTSSANFSDQANQNLSGQAVSRNRKQRRALNRLNTEAIQRFVDSIPSLDARESPRIISSDQQNAAPGCQPLLGDSQLDGHGGSSSLGLDASFADMSGIEALVNGSLESFKSLPEYSNLSADLQPLSTMMAKIRYVQANGHTAILTEDIASALQTLTTQLQVLSFDANAGSSGAQRCNKLDPDFHPDYLRDCQVNARRLVRSLCARIAGLENQISSHATGNSTVLSSGRNLQLLVPPFESHSPDRYSDSGNDSELIRSASSSSYESTVQSSIEGGSSRYGVILQEDGGKALLDAVDYYDEAFESGAGSNIIGTIAIRKAPRHLLVAKTMQHNSDLEVWSSVPSNPNQLIPAPVSPPTTPQDLISSSSTGQNDRHDLHRRTSEQIAPNDFQEDQRATAATISLLEQHVAQHPGTNSLYENFSGSRLASSLDFLHVRSTGSSQETSLPQTSETSLRGAIPRIDLELYGAYYNADGPATALQLPAGGYDVKYSMLVVLAISASLFLLNVVQTSFNQWIDATLLTFLPKLLLCCLLVAQPPSAMRKHVKGLGLFAPMAAVASLLQSSNQSSSILSSSRSSLSKSFRLRTEVAYWLETLSPTTMVV